jgi:hypothetical protein
VLPAHGAMHAVVSPRTAWRDLPHPRRGDRSDAVRVPIRGAAGLPPAGMDAAQAGHAAPIGAVVHPGADPGPSAGSHRRGGGRRGPMWRDGTGHRRAGVEPSHGAKQGGSAPSAGPSVEWKVPIDAPVRPQAGSRRDSSRGRDGPQASEAMRRERVSSQTAAPTPGEWANSPGVGGRLFRETGLSTGDRGALSPPWLHAGGQRTADGGQRAGRSPLVGQTPASGGITTAAVWRRGSQLPRIQVAPLFSAAPQRKEV